MSRSSASSSRSRSLRSHGSVVDPLATGSSQVESKSRKQHAKWSDEETATLLDFLAGELPKAGHGVNFKKSTWNAAASMMAREYQTTKGGVKDADTCERRFLLMKKQYDGVVALKNASGFTYSDKDGAGIKPEQKDIWKRYVKTNPAAKSFKKRGFLHLDSMERFASGTSKGKFVYRSTRPSNTSQSSTVNVHQLSAATDGLSMDDTPQLGNQQSNAPSSSTNLKADDPNVVSPSTPSSFLSPSQVSGSSAVTSVSRAKRKMPSAESEAGSSAYKRTRPLSSAAQAQQAGGVAMQEIATAIRDMSHNLAAPPVDNFSAALDVLNKHKLTAEQRLDIGEYLSDSRNKNDATLFRKSNEEEQMLWLKRRLRMLKEVATKKRSKGGMVSDDGVDGSQPMDDMQVDGDLDT